MLHKELGDGFTLEEGPPAKDDSTFQIDRQPQFINTCGEEQVEIVRVGALSPDCLNQRTLAVRLLDLTDEDKTHPQ